jgi:hypothetical protein
MQAVSISTGQRAGPEGNLCLMILVEIERLNWNIFNILLSISFSFLFWLGSLVCLCTYCHLRVNTYASIIPMSNKEVKVTNSNLVDETHLDTYA